MAFRTQKISQMTPKGADLEATDLIEVSTIESGSYVTRSITGQELIDAIPAPTGFVPDTRTLTINGVAQDLSADRSWTISTGLTVGTTPIASGTIGRVLFQGTGNVLQQSSSLFWDGTNNRLGIGTSTPAYPLDVVGGARFISGATAGAIFGSGTLINLASDAYMLATSASTNAGFLANRPTSGLYASFDMVTGANTNTGWSMQLRPSQTYWSLTNRITDTSAITAFTTSNIGINTTTDAGFRLDVNGTARVQSAGEVLRVQGTTATGNSYVQYRNSSGNLGYIGWGSSVTDHLNIYNEKNADAIFGTNNIERLRILSGGNVGIGTSTSSSGFSGNARVLSIVDNATANVGSFRAYGGGTTTSIELFGSTSLVGLYGHTNHPMTFWTNTAERMRIFAGGNVGINTTTDAGYKLDVNGTARVQGNLTLTSAFQVKFANNNRWIGPSELYAGVQIYAAASGSDVIQMTAGQQVHISSAGGITTQTSSVLQVDSTTKGFLPPRMTTTQKNAIASPATGLQVYDTTLNRPCFYDGTTWITL